MSSVEKKVCLREPLARVKGNGSAKEGVGHWIYQRLTAIALVPLVIWFIVSVITHLGDDYNALILWVSDPLTSILLMLFMGSLFYHLWLGLRVVVEDYVSLPTRYFVLIGIKFALFFLSVLSIFAILKIALGAH